MFGPVDTGISSEVLSFKYTWDDDDDDYTRFRDTSESPKVLVALSNTDIDVGRYLTVND